MERPYPTVRERLLFSLLLTGASSQDSDLRYEMCDILDLHGEGFIMLLFSFDDFWELSYGGNEKFPELFIQENLDSLQSIVSEVFGEKYRYSVSRYKNDAVCILQLAEHKEKNKKELYEAIVQSAKNTVELMRTNFDSQVSVFASKIYDDILNTCHAYEETGRQRRVCAFAAQRGVVILCEQESADNEEVLKQARKLELELYQLIRNRNFEQAKMTAAEYMEKRFGGANIDAQGYFFHLQRFIYELISAFDSMLPPASEEVMKTLKLRERLTGFDSVTDLLQRLCKAIDRLVELEQSKPTNYSWLNKLLEYINENCTDPELNASTVSDHFNKHPAYISRIFRQEIGCGLYEYIQKLRIAKAKQLLCKNKTLMDTAMEAGFGSTNAMNRAFAKYENSLPREFVHETDNPEA